MSNGKRNEQSQSVSQYSLQHCVRVYRVRFSPRSRNADANCGGTVHAAQRIRQQGSPAGSRRLAHSIGTSRQRCGPLEGIADTIPLVMMGMVELNDLDDLAAIVEKHGRAVHDAATPEDVQRAQLKEAVKAAFDHVRPVRRDAVR